MLGYYDRGGSHGWSRYGQAPGEFGIGMKHEACRCCSAPQDIDFVILNGPISSHARSVTRQRVVHMQMYGNGCRRVFEIFARVNVVKRRLQESPQERDYTENDAAGPHSFP